MTAVLDQITTFRETLTDVAALFFQHYRSDAKAAIIDSSKPLRVAASDGQVVVHSMIPEGLEIVDNDSFEGKRIIANKIFDKGSLVYVGYAVMLDLSAAGHGYKLRVYSEDGRGKRQFLHEFDSNDTHSVDDYADGSKNGETSKRQIFGWDGFMNHSCDPNIYFPLLFRTPTELCYRAVALRDIAPGEEVTCDYALFDYSCDGHEIEACACKSSKCRGKMLGFNALSLQEKINILHLVEEEIKSKFIVDDNVKVFNSQLPEGIALKQGANLDSHLMATQKFEAGQLLFRNRAEIINNDDLECKKFVLEVDGKYILLDNYHHFIHRQGGYAEMLGFDSFMDHSCSPNTYQEYIDRENYAVYAKKAISPGEKITCDYLALDNGSLGILGSNVGTSSFVCNCGESNCKGMLVC